MDVVHTECTHPDPLLVDQTLNTRETGIPTQTVLRPIPESAWAPFRETAVLMCGPPGQQEAKGSCWQRGSQQGWSVATGSRVSMHGTPQVARQSQGRGKKKDRMWVTFWCENPRIPRVFLFKTDLGKVYFSGYKNRIYFNIHYLEL